MGKYDFSGWATKNDLLCGDGRTIKRDAFKDNDGKTVPLVWNHDHSNPEAVLGHALLENREDGVYAYGTFNDTPAGQHAKQCVQNGDVSALSIWANKLKQVGKDVIHGQIRELSLVLSGANPGAFIDFVMAHGEDTEDELYAGYDINGIVIYHSDEEDKDMAEETKKPEGGEGKTVKEVIDAMTEEQKTAVAVLIGSMVEDEDDDEDNEAEHSDMEDEEGGNVIMHSNVFDKGTQTKKNVLSHADEEAILTLAKQTNVGSFKTAFKMYLEEHDELAHGFVDEEGNDAIETLFPEFKLLKPGAPELIERDLSWVDHVLNKIHKSPISRIRTRQADARIAELRAKGYQKKGDEKTLSGNIKLIGRTTEPQTIYRKEQLHRDDIIDITEFNLVDYVWQVAKHNMNEELALAALIGDGREDADPDKIHEDRIRPIWLDDEMYTIHRDVDIEAMKQSLQGTNTAANFSENYIYAEAIVQSALYAREKYKGSGNLEFYCTPHLLNVMLLSRDLNGRRIYSSKADLQAALNVSAIHTVEQFEGKVREDKDGKQHKLLGLFVNLADYQFGCTKGGEITKFEHFDIDFNIHKYLMETRLSGSLTKLWSAIALEEPVTEEAAG